MIVRKMAITMVGTLSIGSALLLSLKFLRHSSAEPAPMNATTTAPPAPNPQMPTQPASGPQAGTPPPAGAPPVPGIPTPPPPNGAPPAPPAGAGSLPGAANPGAPPAVPGTPDPNSQNAGITQLEGFLEPFIYDIVNRRDPFLPYAEFIAKPEGQAEDTGPQRALSPAQRWDLDQLKLIGIMWDIKDPKAMFLDPEQDVMILGRDESIGNRNGYVATIREGEVVVVEALRKRGDIIYRTKVLRIER